MFQTIKSKIVIMIVVFLGILFTMVFLNLQNGFNNIAKNNSSSELNKLNALLYEGLKLAMNTGDPLVINGFIEASKKIEGVGGLEIFPSQKVIEIMEKPSAFTEDKEILDIFNTKKEKIVPYKNEKDSGFLMLKPVVAEEACVMCHVSTQVGEPLGVVKMQISDKELVQNSNAVKREVFLWMFGLSVIALFFLLFVFNHLVFNPIKKLADVAYDISQGEGDLTRRLPVKNKDEIAKASSYINDFIQKIHDTIESAKDSAHYSKQQANSLFEASNQINKRIYTSVEVTQESTKLGKEIEEMLEVSSKLVETSAEDIKKSSKELLETKKLLLKMADEMQNNMATEHAIADRLAQNAQDTNRIKDVLTIIAEIADQTSLLALNASIEAARAGESGRGFAVVADEVRKLAERTHKSLGEINAVVNLIIQASNDANEVMRQNVENTSKITQMSMQSGEVVEESVKSLEEAVRESSASLQKTNELVSAVHNVLAQVEKIESLTYDNNKSVQLIDKVTRELANNANLLDKQLDSFRC
ncbi:methyl-accepting chemotaxis protein [Helicobacter burdigaliensis]|uniref:methyl-accepting chemotaxis protein n=1 Tax=Helicobacter burdigaliensis TaxID=2315334 RepID=UPI000EF6FA2F|nr:methyl-accepting chemotaxis protein [Helicobacter burdigaliensis]